MSQPYVGQIIAVGFTFAPPGWVVCDGSLLAVSDYAELFQIISNTFGGDGVSTFAVPDLRGRVVVGAGQGPGLANYPQGQVGGAESVSLTIMQNGAHTHPVMASGVTTNPTAYDADPDPGEVLGAPQENAFYAASGTATTLAPTTLDLAGGGAAHENRQPYQTINYIIATEGLFPSPG